MSTPPPRPGWYDQRNWLIKFGVWVALLSPVFVWELLAFFVHRGTFAHPTISQMIKASQHHRLWASFLWAVAGVVLFLHLVYPTF